MRPSLILSSPFARAVQTAEIAGRALEHPCEIVQSGSLTPDSSPQALWEEVRTHPAQALLLVGHAPLLPSAASFMLGASRVAVEFAPAALMCIHFADLGPEPRGVLRWMIAPQRA